jgi:hypothetical protein
MFMALVFLLFFLMTRKMSPPNHKTRTNPIRKLGKTPYEPLKEEQEN